MVPIFMVSMVPKKRNSIKIEENSFLLWENNQYSGYFVTI